jgi:hypothetical protein
MRNRLALLTCLFTLIAFQACAQVQGCLASTSLGTIRLLVRPPDRGPYKPLEAVNLIGDGYQIRYEPVRLGTGTASKARVALAAGCVDQAGAPARLEVLPPAPADRSTEWRVPCRVSVVAFVFGPQGLDAGRVRSLLAKDEELITQLAQYAEQTAMIEALISALAEVDPGATTGKTLEAALAGFAQRTGTSVGKWDRNAPTEQQAMLLLRALNPALAAYDPLAPQPAARVERSAGLAAAVAGLFLGDAFGLAAGSAGLAYNLKTLLFPGTDFRSALAQQVAPDAIRLCARRDTTKSRTRMAYLWAYRLSNASPPRLALREPAHLPVGTKSVIHVSWEGDWKLVSRLRAWRLTSASGSWPAQVTPEGEGRLILEPAAGIAPGTYRLAADWDWQVVEVNGEIHVHPLPRLEQARLTPESRDALAEGNGLVEIILQGTDFQFVERVGLRPAGADAVQPLEFALPRGPRSGPQPTLKLKVDTNRLRAGDYLLVLTQSGDGRAEIPVRVHPPHPRLDGLPLRVPAGEDWYEFELRGRGLQRLTDIRSPGATIVLEAGTDDVRRARLRLNQAVRRGQRLPLELYVQGLHQPLRTDQALLVVGPRPKVSGVKISYGDDIGVSLSSTELPARGWVTAALEVEALEEPFRLKLSCLESARSLQQDWFRPGSARTDARVEHASGGGLFLMLEPGKFGQAGCTLAVTIENEHGGTSEPFPLGRIVRVPRIEQLTLTDEPAGESAYYGILIGQELETIVKAGWDESTGLPVGELPRPLAGESRRQSLRLALPWPPPAPRAPLYVWLQGDEHGRRTAARF